MNKHSLAPFIGCLLIFYFTWTVVWVYGVYPWAVRNVGSTTLLYAVINIVFRFLIWVLPVFWYLRHVDRVNATEYLRLRQHWGLGLAFGLVLSAVNFAAALVRTGPSTWRGPYVTWNSIVNTAILIGFFEEVPFRGFILQKLTERFGFWRSVVMSSVLFVTAHIPGWIRLGTLTAYNAVFVFVFGVIMALVFRYSKSLWGPIVAHSLNDFISGVLVHR